MDPLPSAWVMSFVLSPHSIPGHTGQPRWTRYPVLGSCHSFCHPIPYQATLASPDGPVTQCLGHVIRFVTPFHTRPHWPAPMDPLPSAWVMSFVLSPHSIPGHTGQPRWTRYPVLGSCHSFCHPIPYQATLVSPDGPVTQCLGHVIRFVTPFHTRPHWSALMAERSEAQSCSLADDCSSIIVS